MATSSYKENYIGMLDGLRGAMALWVFCYHTEMACIGKTPPWGAGARAVDIFMLLSGFLMAYHWQIRKEKFAGLWQHVLDFYIRRFFRIAPLYYLLLTAALLGHEYFGEMKYHVTNIVSPPGGDIGTGLHLHTGTGKSIFSLDTLMHYSFLFGFFPRYAETNILPDWSIGLEMQFYLFFPLLMVAINKFGGFSVVLIAYIIAFITNKLVGLPQSPGVVANFPQPSLLLFKINLFISGICLAYLYFNKFSSRETIKWLLLTAISLSKSSFQVQLAALFIAFVFLFDHENNELLNKLSTCKIAKFFGDISYSVYLSHNLLLIPGLYILYKYSWFSSMQIYLRFMVAFVFIGVPVSVMSCLLFKTVELPGINMGRKVLRAMKLASAP